MVTNPTVDGVEPPSMRGRLFAMTQHTLKAEQFNEASGGQTTVGIAAKVGGVAAVISEDVVPIGAAPVVMPCTPPAQHLPGRLALTAMIAAEPTAAEVWK